MPSKFYVENCGRTNEWLQKNAPKYVTKCIQELADTALSLGKRAVEAETVLHQLGNIIEDENGK